MKILVISGFLGAGKTTFIKTLAENTKKNFVVLENEFSDVSIDGPLLGDIRTPVSFEDAIAAEEKLPEDAKIWELTEGCICCSLSLNFANSVLTIANTLDPDYLVIEPSGVALLGAILDQLRRICYERIQLLSPITLIDFQNHIAYLNEFSEFVSDQVKNAGWIFFTKNENCNKEEIQIQSQKIQEVNPAAAILTDHYSSFTPSIWETILNRSIDTAKEHAEGQKDTAELSGLESLSLINPELESIPQLVGALQILISGCVGYLPRCKGFLEIQKEWIRFDVVNDRYEISGTLPQKEARIAVIGKKLCRDSIRQLFRGYIFMDDVSHDL